MAENTVAESLAGDPVSSSPVSPALIRDARRALDRDRRERLGIAEPPHLYVRRRRIEAARTETIVTELKKHYPPPAAFVEQYPDLVVGWAGSWRYYKRDNEWRWFKLERDPEWKLHQVVQLSLL